MLDRPSLTIRPPRHEGRRHRGLRHGHPCPLPTRDTTVDLTAAKAVATQLARNATDAAGLLHPHGTGPAARIVTFHTWA